MDKYLEEAIAEYERNIESGHSFYMDAPILMDIEEYYEKHDRAYDAERIMRFAEKLHPDSEDVLVVKAYRFKSAGKWQQALNTIRRIPNQESRDVQLFLIEWDVAMARIDKAEQRFEENYRLVSPPDDEDWLYDFGEVLIDYGYNERGLKYLKRISSTYSMHRRVDELVGDVCCQLGRYGESVDAFTRLVDSDPYDSVSWTQLADVQYKAKHFEQTSECCDYALAIDDTNWRAMLLKLCSKFAMQSFDEAMQLYGEYVKKGYEDYGIHLLAGEELNKQGRYAEARKPLQEALRLCPIDSPERPRVVSALADVFIAYGKNDEACELTQTLVQSGSMAFDLYLHLANSFVEFHNNQAAVEMLDNALHAPGIGEKDIVTVIQFLARNGLYEPAASLWEQLVDVKFTEECIPYYSYVVYAMVEMKNHALFTRSYLRASSACPQALCEVFFSTRRARTLGELSSYLKEEVASW